MDNKRLDRIETKIDDVSEHLSEINTTLGAQHVSIKEHIRRCNLLEEELKPIKAKVNMVEGALKLITLAAALAAIVEVILHR